MAPPSDRGRRHRDQVWQMLAWLVVSLLGAVIVIDLEGVPFNASGTYFARLLGAAAASFYLAFLICWKIKGWLGGFVGIFVIIMLDMLIGHGRN